MIYIKVGTDKKWSPGLPVWELGAGLTTITRKMLQTQNYERVTML